MRYLLAHDLGTSGNKAALFAEDGTLIGSKTKSYALYQEEPLRAEQDPEEWWRAVCDSTRELIQGSGIAPEEIAALSFSGQMMGCLPVDREGEPLRRSIIWADQRAQAQAAQIGEKIGLKRFYSIVGHRNTASYGIQKAMWIRDNEPETYRNTYKFLNAKDYIVFRLTGKFYTDPSDANSMTCFDLKTLDWSDEILQAAGISREKLPEVVPSIRCVGTVTEKAAKETGLSTITKVIMGAGDGVAANVGAGSVSPGKAFCCLGTSAWVASTSEKPVLDKEMRIVCWAHAVPGLYSPNGTMQYACGSYSWFKNTVGTEEILAAKAEGRSPYDLLNAKAQTAKAGSGGVIFLPYLLGERAPRWNPFAKGAYLGLTASTTREELIRATIEGITLNLAVCLDALNKEKDIDAMTVIGGGAKGEDWCKILADIFGMPVRIPASLEEAGSMGAAVIAGVGAGLYDDFTVVDRFLKIRRTIEPDPSVQEIYRGCKEQFENYYKALEPFFKEN